MLPGARLRDDSLLSHSAGQEDLAQGVIDLMRAGVTEILTLDVDFRSPEFVR
jgi:hypothetical protein